MGYHLMTYEEAMARTQTCKLGMPSREEAERFAQALGGRCVAFRFGADNGLATVELPVMDRKTTREEYEMNQATMLRRRQGF